MIQCPNCLNDENSDFTGHEVRGVYDGVLVWQCAKCGHAFPREFGIGRRDEAARIFADQLNARGDAKSIFGEEES